MEVIEAVINKSGDLLQVVGVFIIIVQRVFIDILFLIRPIIKVI